MPQWISLVKRITTSPFFSGSAFSPAAVAGESAGGSMVSAAEACASDGVALVEAGAAAAAFSPCFACGGIACASAVGKPAAVISNTEIKIASTDTLTADTDFFTINVKRGGKVFGTIFNIVKASA